MSRARSSLAFLAAAISAALGVASLLPADRGLPRTPAWRGVVAPLAAAPLPRGTFVGLIDRQGEEPSYSRFLLLEAAWRRPDVWWERLNDFPHGSLCTTAVTTDARLAPPGWRAAWKAGDVVVWRRAQP